MKRAFLLLCFSTQLAFAAAPLPDYLVQNYRAGRISADMTPELASKQYPPERVKWWAPYPRVHVIDIDPTADPNAPAALRLYLDRDQKRIVTIGITDIRFRTAQGIGIGSTFGALRKAHPRLTIRTEEGEMDRFIVAEILGEGIACQLQFDELTWKKMLLQPDRFNVPAEIIPEDRVIQSMTVYRPMPVAPAAGSFFGE